MAARLPSDARWRYERSVRRRRGDRWAFVLVITAALCALSFIGDRAVVSLAWLPTLPGAFGFTMFSGPPARRHAGYAAQMFPASPTDGQDSDPPIADRIGPR
jgi:hypothetical protein